jgi:alanine dehydrogenase
MITLGLIREYKYPPDKRVAFSPSQCSEIQAQNPDITFIVESSPDRVFSDQEYLHAGIKVSTDLTDCDILFGIKEVPVANLIPEKTYCIFSHTIKKQPHNREMLRAMLNNKIRLIDYECLHAPNGTRLLGFGRYAGLAGTYEAFKAIGIRRKSFELKPPLEIANLAEMESVLLTFESKIKALKSKIVIAGSGRVAAGCEEMLSFIHLQKVTPEQFLSQSFDESVYTLLDTFDLYERIDGQPWNHEHFFKNHAAYQSKFTPYTEVADVLINGVFWDKQMPQHFSKEDTKSPHFSIKTIADISCDVEGSVPITLYETKTDKPVMGWDPILQKECEPYLETGIDVMAISNLPTEIPEDASVGFGSALIDTVLPELLKDQSEIIKNATICDSGKLTNNYLYLTDYVND